MAKFCMNAACRTTTTLEWKKGWELKSGGFAALCFKCGSAYENLVYCETFHLEESGWRECRLCRKRIHCGCIASKCLHDYLDFGGVGCISCAKSLETRLVRPIQVPTDDIRNGFGPMAKGICDPQSSFLENGMGGIKRKLAQMSQIVDAEDISCFTQTQRSETKASNGQIMLPEVGTGFSDLMQQSVGSSIFANPENSRHITGVKDVYQSITQPPLSFSLSTPLDTSNSALPSPGEAMEAREQNVVSSFQEGQRDCHIFPKPPNTSSTVGLEENKGMASHTRVARPPVEGRGCHQLLPRYWPRITDQELQQISGHLNSTIVPLFEKVLSASDAGRIGRLVLPKACAEAYFPPISQSDGVPIRIQDIKGKEWTFQFRFWPNNNSRMYVLEGVTPCIQNMQLQAGDTVIFSRLDPENKLVMGFRKASNSVDMQDNQTSAPPNATQSGETTLCGVNNNPTTHGERTNKDPSKQPVMVLEKKRTRNIGSKSKRLLMHSEDATKLRITWEDAQGLLRPPPNAKPTIVMIENQEFEEYEEPPVFGKRTIFTARLPGEQEQWGQCDSCFKWRRLPGDVLLPPRWTCLDNIWDPSKCSCSAPVDMNPKDLQSLLQVGKDFKKRRIIESPKVPQECEPSGLDALATAAVLGDSISDSAEPLVGPTTKHPRHRPGCTCIVCIQPPSGKGRHISTCICNVCLTMKRRCNTLMLRKKKRQSEREVEIAQVKEDIPPKDEPETNEDETNQNQTPEDVSETGKGELDLNCHPSREEDTLGTSLSMTRLVHAASLPLEMYLRQNGLKDLGPSSLLRSAGESESEGCPPDDGYPASLIVKQENQVGEG
ncbi:hypothetical protein NMG60_11034339 [Bertholletia excelsa]